MLKYDKIDKKHIEIEIESQLNEFINLFKMYPISIECHQHIHLSPKVSEILIELMNDI